MQILEPIVDLLSQEQAQNTKILDIAALTTVADQMVIASGTSERHVKAMASRLKEWAKQEAIPLLGVEGEEEGRWILMDFNNVLVQLMHPETRQFYQLEALWQPLHAD